MILDELKTKAAHRNIPLPVCLADCLKETKANSQSEYVVPNREGDPLSYTQFKRLWQYIVTRTVKERFYYRYQTATAALCSLSAGSYSGRTGHADRFGSLLCHRLIGKNIAVLQTWKQLQQRNCLRAIVNISGRQQKSHRPQVFSDDGMDFRVQTSACFADAA